MTGVPYPINKIPVFQSPGTRISVILLDCRAGCAVHFFLLFSCVLDLLLNSRVYKLAVAWSNGKAW